LDSGVRVPLLAGSTVFAVELPEDALLLAAPPPLDPIADVGAAVGEALRFPLSGPPLEALARTGSRVTVVVEPPLLPLPGVEDDPRREALAAVLDELAVVGVRPADQTVLVAGGLGRRAGRRQLDDLLPSARARDFRGTLVVHDAEGETLRLLGELDGVPFRVAAEVLDADLVVTVTAAESVLHGGPAALLGACGPEAARAAGAVSLLEPVTSSGWRLAAALEALLMGRVPLVGVSLVLDHPRPTGRQQGWPWEPDTVARMARSPLRRVHNALPSAARHALLRSLDRRLDAVAALAGPPTVAHAEGMLRGTSLRAARLEAPVDTIVIPVPWQGAYRQGERLGPLAATHLALGVALRLWRERPPLAPGGSVAILHGFRPTFERTASEPYSALFEALGDPDPRAVERAEATVAADPGAVDAYRAGRAPHPLLPFAERSAWEPALAAAGRVIVGGCRDAAAARRLGFVPSHSPQAALEMALGVSEGGRLGVLLSPPYPPLVVG
jgi:hypothetical protein